MTSSTKQLRRQATLKALYVRNQLPAGLADAVSPFEIAHTIANVIVKFNELPLEGIYHATNPRIILSSQRPWVRQNFTCAHELGHFFLGHGFQVEELVELRDTSSYDIPEELAADTFAGELLMPKTTISSGFISRGYQMSSCNPIEYYIVSQWLGVGYTTMLNHLRYFQCSINSNEFKALERYKRQNIRAEILGRPCKNEIFVIDQHWKGRSVDLAIGDYLISEKPLDFSDESFIERQPQPNTTFQFCYKTIKRGCLNTTLINGAPNKKIIRISPERYVGLEKFRYLEDDE